ncbi:hypothetical protein BKA62DRAFT_684407 [Auriculariales sp. MPI-PUGE-AT-0066]|nr:hypothetical protein BKA62DRAFT_684407 [Auriculariales sp. MPI-PUGE-AT-0066]
MHFAEELVELVLTSLFSLPDAVLTSRLLPQRAKPCCAAALVCQSWYRIAQTLLYRTVWLSTKAETQLFFRTMEDNTALRLLVRNLRLDDPNSACLQAPLALQGGKLHTLHISLGAFDGNVPQQMLELQLGPPYVGHIVAVLQPQRIVVTLQNHNHSNFRTRGLFGISTPSFAQNAARLNCLKEVETWTQAETIILHFTLSMKDLGRLKLGGLVQLRNLHVQIDFGELDKAAMLGFLQACPARSIVVVPGKDTSLFLQDFEEMLRQAPDLGSRVKVEQSVITCLTVIRTTEIGFRLEGAALMQWKSSSKTPLATSHTARRWEL